MTAEQFADAIGSITGDWHVYQPTFTTVVAAKPVCRPVHGPSGNAGLSHVAVRAMAIVYVRPLFRCSYAHPDRFGHQHANCNAYRNLD